MTPLTRTRLGDAGALLAGAALPLAFAPFHLALIAPAAVAVLFAMWSGATAARSAWRGFLFGFGLFGVGVSWVYVSLHTYGNMPGALAVVAVIIFVGLMSLFPALAGYVQGRLTAPDTPLRLLCASPALWVLAEWAREWALSGFPWLSLGYSQTESPLLAYAPVVGVYGVSVIVAFTAGALAALWRRRDALTWVAIGALGAAWLAGVPLARLEWVRPAGAPLTAGLVQANISLGQKWAPGGKDAITQLYLDLSAPHDDLDLIVWPEASLPTYLDTLPQTFWETLERHPADFVFGILERQTRAEGEQVYNSAVGVGEQRQLYRKRHLVPFGEFLPLKPLFGWLLRYLHIPMSDFARWEDTQSPMRLAGELIGVSICYEDAFVEEVTAALPGATVLVNVSEDAWFGDSLASHQRLQMGRMRARETGRPMLRAANSGISAAVDHRGDVLARSPQFERLVLVTAVQPMQGTTPFVRWGHGPALLLCGLGLLVVLSARRRRR